MDDEEKNLAEKFKKLPPEEQEKIIGEIAKQIAESLKPTLSAMEEMSKTLTKFATVSLKRSLIYMMEKCPRYGSRECIHPRCHACDFFKEAIEQ